MSAYETLTTAYRKQLEGADLSPEEQQAVARYEAEQEEKRRWQHYASIPKKHWQIMSGRAQQILNEQAKRYGLPVGQAVIDLRAFVRWLHDFLERHSGAFGKDGAATELLRYRRDMAKEQARRLRFRNDLDAGTLVRRDDHEHTLTALVRLFVQAVDGFLAEAGARVPDRVDELGEVGDAVRCEVAGKIKTLLDEQEP